MKIFFLLTSLVMKIISHFPIITEKTLKPFFSSMNLMFIYKNENDEDEARMKIIVPEEDEVKHRVVTAGDSM